MFEFLALLVFGVFTLRSTGARRGIAALLTLLVVCMDAGVFGVLL